MPSWSQPSDLKAKRQCKCQNAINTVAMSFQWSSSMHLKDLHCDFQFAVTCDLTWTFPKRLNT